MKYISIGAVMTEGTEHILDVCRGSRSYHLTGELASVWLNGRFGFAAVKKPTEEQALLLLLRMGLAIQTDGSGFEEYRALTQCTLVPADRKHPYWGLTGMERAVLQWLREAGLVLSMAELTYLIDQKVPLQADLLGNANTQNLVEQIYTRDTIDDGILEGQMERSNAREPVTKAVLRLLRKKRLGDPHERYIPDVPGTTSEADPAPVRRSWPWYYHAPDSSRLCP